MIDLGNYHLEHDEIPPKRAWSGSSDQKWILNPFRKFGTGEARNLKFSVLIYLGKSHFTIEDKIPPKGAWSGSRVEFLNFKTPS